MILDLSTPRVITARSLARAFARELDKRHGSRRDFAIAHNMAQVDVSRATCATGTRFGDSTQLMRVARLHGYQRHPDMPGHYRRLEAAPEPDAPDPDEDVDEETEQFARELSAERDDEDAGPDPMLADLLEDAAHERFLEQLAADADMWRRDEELSWTPDERAYHAERAREDRDGASA